MYCLFWICSGNYSSTVGFINNTIEREFHGGKLWDVIHVEGLKVILDMRI